MGNMSNLNKDMCIIPVRCIHTQQLTQHRIKLIILRFISHKKSFTQGPVYKNSFIGALFANCPQNAPFSESEPFVGRNTPPR